jgi:hypothetical protein
VKIPLLAAGVVHSRDDTSSAAPPPETVRPSDRQWSALVEYDPVVHNLCGDGNYWAPCFDQHDPSKFKEKYRCCPLDNTDGTSANCTADQPGQCLI